jgi:hypothetical protein
LGAASVTVAGLIQDYVAVFLGKSVGRVPQRIPNVIDEHVSSAKISEFEKFQKLYNYDEFNKSERPKWFLKFRMVQQFMEMMLLCHDATLSVQFLASLPGPGLVIIFWSILTKC